MLGVMKPIEVSETIHAPIEAVFAVVSDIPNAAKTIGGINSIEMLSEGPVGEGTKWREERTLFGKTATEVMWIVAWHPPTRYVVEARSHGTHYLTTVHLEEIGQHETRIGYSMLAEPETMMSKVMMVVFAGMKKFMVKCLSDDLRDIKRVCEAAEQPTAV